MIVLCSKPGQLGNRLFLFAHLVAFSEAYGHRIMNVSFDEYAEYFPAFARDGYCRYPLKFSLFRGRIFRRGCYRFYYYLARVMVRLGTGNRFLRVQSLDWNEKINMDEPAFRELADSSRLLLLQGWEFRCPDAFRKHSGLIRTLFVPDPGHMERVEAVASSARKSADVLVGIHIRHGDYAVYEGGRYFYSFDQYATLMRRIRDQFESRRVTFVVCSNAAVPQDAFHGLDVVHGTGHFVEDLYLFSRCDYLAGPPSTFTSWASFFGKVPLYMIRSAGEAPVLGKFITHSE